MVIKQKIFTPLKMVKDVVASKQKDGNYFHAKNLRFNTHKDTSTGGFTLEKGNSISFYLPEVKIDYASTSFKYVSNGVLKQLVYKSSNVAEVICDIEKDFEDGLGSNDVATQIIVGHSISRDGLVLFSTNSNGFDCIWYVEDTEGVKSIELKYCRNLNLSIEHPLKCISSFENSYIDKTYWIDGHNQQRSVNIKDVNLVNVKINVLDMVGNFDLSQAYSSGTFPGGSHTAGMIQYAYNLYRLNGSQTKISPLSELVSLDKDIYGGGELNEVVSKTVSVEIDNLDTSYTNMKLYAIKYTSYNQAPSISVILDQSIPNSKKITYYDDGSVLYAVSNETFLFLGGELLVPNSMTTKLNRMFLSNYTEKSYDLINATGTDVADGCRAFSYDSSGNCVLANSMEKSPSGSQIGVEKIGPFSSTLPLKPDSIYSCINVDYAKYKFNKDGGIGGSGEFLKYTLTRSTTSDSNFSEEDADGRFFKDGELYRISIQFYSKYGEVSTPKWIADFVTQQVSNGNLKGFYGTLTVELLPAFYAWIQTVDPDKRPVGYKILRAERKTSDKTILAQGIINGMVAIAAAVKGDPRPADYSVGAKEFCHTKAIKIPSMIRTFDDSLCPMWGNRTYFAIPRANHPQGSRRTGTNGSYLGNVSEIYHFGDSDDARKMSYQFNKLMQFNCPEIEFDLINKISAEKMTVIGSLANTANEWWGKETHVSSKNVLAETKTKNSISPFDFKAALTGNREVIVGSSDSLQDHGIVGPSGNNDGFDSNQFYREYNGDFTFNKKSYEIYGTPEISERGQGKRTYKKNTDFSYTNTLEPMSSDNAEEVDAIEKKGVNRVDSYSCKSAFVVLGNDFDTTENRPSIESVFTEMGFQDKKSILLCEFKINEILLYVGGLYGGNSYEDKKRTNYIEIGNYNPITETSVFIKNPGDTFVANYKFERISKKGVETSDCTVSYITEIVSFKTETSIDLRRRNDLSINDWDNKFMPEYADYRKYNRVYSQEPNLIYRRDNDYNFRSVTSFETSIIATKQKIPNEPIDSWTDILVNEQMDLDGRYGPINALVSFGDEVFTFQDRAIARISIAPRVQVTGDDGVQVQLGTGQLFNEYKYLTTTSGSVNEWGVCVGERGIYYIDALNKSFCMISNQEMKNISDEEGFHKEFQELINLALVEIDNPLKKTGVSLGYDSVTKDVYVSILNGNNSVTIAYNELSKGFSSYYDYDAPMYIFNKKEMLTVSPFNGGAVYKNFEGDYNEFYGVKRKSLYSVVLAPEPMTECIFNNIEYNTLSKNKDGVEVDNTWESVRVYNEFQDSGHVDLKIRDNIRKKNRQYRITLPRQSNSRDRIRNNWAIMELELSNQLGNSITMNDIVLYYTPNYIVIR